MVKFKAGFSLGLNLEVKKAGKTVKGSSKTLTVMKEIIKTNHRKDDVKRSG